MMLPNHLMLCCPSSWDARAWWLCDMQSPGPGIEPESPALNHFENFDDWPFLWGQNEGTIAGNTQYIIFGSSLKNIVAE